MPHLSSMRLVRLQGDATSLTPGAPGRHAAAAATLPPPRCHRRHAAAAITQAFVVGEVLSTAVDAGDVLLVSAGPGYFSTVTALSGEAQRAGAKVIVFSSQPPSPLQDFADVCIQVPATCLPPTPLLLPAAASAAPRMASGDSVLLMGSSYELALQLFFDIVCILLRNKLGGVSTGQMLARHTNLE